MRRWTHSLCIPVLLVVWVTGSALAQMGQGGRRLYNPATEITVQGTIEKVTETAGRQGWPGLHLVLRSEGATYSVHVGPADYLARRGFKFSTGDQIQVTGSKISPDTIVAREIKKDGKLLVLRNNQGVPEWSGGSGRAY